MKLEDVLKITGEGILTSIAGEVIKSQVNKPLGLKNPRAQRRQERVREIAQEIEDGTRRP